jgi:hypothetical protein
MKYLFPYCPQKTMLHDSETIKDMNKQVCYQINQEIFQGFYKRQVTYNHFYQEVNPNKVR